MKRKLRTVLTVILSLVLVLSVGMLLRQAIGRRSAENAASQAQQLAGIPTQPELPADSQDDPENAPLLEQPSIVEDDTQIITDETPALSELPEDVPPMAGRPIGWQDAPVTDDPYFDALAETDLQALREVNEDVLGWIFIPDSPINYPLMDGDDNNFYLNNAWDQTPSFYGSIFLEQQNSSDLTDFNTIIYGHNMGDENMFGALKHYGDASYWQERPYVYIVDDSGVHRYEIFAAYETPIRSFTYMLGFDNDLRQQFIDASLDRSVLDTGVTPIITNRILTLSTCTGYTKNTRWVVQARLVSVLDAE